MDSQERVTAGLNHREPDRTPIDLGGTIVSSVTKAAYVELEKHLGMPLQDFTPRTEQGVTCWTTFGSSHNTTSPLYTPAERGK